MHDHDDERRRQRGPAGHEIAIAMDPRVAFAARWAPHGGGAPQDICDPFGLTVPEFYRKVLALLYASDASDAQGVGWVPAAVQVRLETMARRRLWLGR